MSAKVALKQNHIQQHLAVKRADLKVCNLKKSFSGKEILRDVSFKICSEEAVSLIGANGSGKSTLIRCCLRLIEPDGGRLEFFGQDLMLANQRGLRKIRSKVGFVSQKHNLVPRLSVLSNVLHGALAYQRSPRLWFQGFAPSVLREKAMHCLELVGLQDFGSRRADHLSGGQSQRVAIARALMQQPEFIIADEPVASLDPQAGDEVMELFVSLVRKEKITLLFSSHNLDHAIKYSDRILGLRNGEIEIDTASSGQSAFTLRGFYE
ncbi:MAG: ATP-binding cassette domain-containing protein [Candidatus Dadabacteria bacterium]|nr:MAG: ATP-binding cassette domain-containing protein [Candidatus Dadabacteria bacterium]